LVSGSCADISGWTATNYNIDFLFDDDEDTTDSINSALIAYKGYNSTDETSDNYEPSFPGSD